MPHSLFIGRLSRLVFPPKVDAAAFGDYTSYYYRAGSPEKSPEMLEYFITKMLPDNPDSGFVMGFFFGRIAQGHPGVLRGYESLFLRASPQGRKVILDALAISADSQTRDFLAAAINDKRFAEEKSEIADLLKANLPLNSDVLKHPIRGGPDLDLHWVEFIVTGKPDSVRRIVDVLERPDRLREKLLDGIRQSASLSQDERWRVRTSLFKTAGFVLDLTRNEIINPQDLELLASMERGGLSRNRFQAVMQALPFPLTEQDLTDIGVKGIARWSLGSNAVQHPLVLQICEEETATRSGKSRLALLEILANTYLAQGDYGNAAKKGQEYLALATTRPGMRQSVERGENELQALLELSAEVAAQVPGQKPDPEQVTARAAATTGAAKTYLSELLFKDRSRKDLKSKDYVTVDLRLSFVGGEPDRHWVNQKAHDTELGELYDEWITIGSDHFDNSGIWINKENPERLGLNRFLRVESYLSILRSEVASSSSVYRFRERLYNLLTYRLPGLERLAPSSLNSKGPVELVIWIDSETGLLTKAQVHCYVEDVLGKATALEIEHVFAGYGLDIWIEPPPTYLTTEEPER